jgi:hypothetical protein
MIVAVTECLLVKIVFGVGREPLSPSEWRDEQATTLSDVDYEPEIQFCGW